MQLSLTAPAGAATAAVEVTKVELLDVKGEVLQTLTAHAPTKYETDKYVAWDQQLAAGATLQVMYPLSAPAWNKLGGRWSAHDKSFQLRVTMTIGSASQKVTRQAIVPTRLSPPVPT